MRSSNLAGIFPEVSGTMSLQVEDEANAYFQRIYNHLPNQLDIDEVLKLLKKFQTSGVPRETDVFNCMIKNLFEKYNFLPQYPDIELHITAQLYGGIIEHSLVTKVPLGLALRLVLEALRKPTDSNMFNFGVTALDRFKSRLKEYPQYCQHVKAIQHFKDFPAHLVPWVEAGTLSSEPPSKPTAPVQLSANCRRSRSPRRALSLSPLGAGQSPCPAVPQVPRDRQLPPSSKHPNTPPPKQSILPLSGTDSREDKSNGSVEREKCGKSGENETDVGRTRKDEGREHPLITGEEVDMSKSNTLTGKWVF